jgi:predicted 3-demethylubiquinone-9 3-methyltransferase (glyoxalase superfamily)
MAVLLVFISQNVKLNSVGCRKPRANSQKFLVLFSKRTAFLHCTPKDLRRNVGGTSVGNVSTCLWFDHGIEAAVRFYVSLVADSRVDSVQRAPAAWPGGAAGDVILIHFTLGGQSFQALNGGSRAEYGTAASISVSCATQAEVDRIWDVLTADGGSEIMCGWLRGRWGVPWQVVPAVLPLLLADADPAVAARAFAAMQAW